MIIIIMTNKIKIVFREGKFFGLFNIVSFPNNLCNSSQDLMQGDIFLEMMILMMPKLILAQLNEYPLPFLGFLCNFCSKKKNFSTTKMCVT